MASKSNIDPSLATTGDNLVVPAAEQYEPVETWQELFKKNPVVGTKTLVPETERAMAIFSHAPSFHDEQDEHLKHREKMAILVGLAYSAKLGSHQEVELRQTTDNSGNIKIRLRRVKDPRNGTSYILNYGLPVFWDHLRQGVQDLQRHIGVQSAGPVVYNAGR